MRNQRGVLILLRNVDLDSLTEILLRNVDELIERISFRRTTCHASPFFSGVLWSVGAMLVSWMSNDWIGHWTVPGFPKERHAAVSPLVLMTVATTAAACKSAEFV